MRKALLTLFLMCAFAESKEIEAYKLQNGLQIVLRPNLENEDEVAFAMMAKGGFSALPESEQISGRVASDIVWESGFNGQSADKISNILYDDYSEMVLSIDPFARKIEGSTYEEGLLTCVKLIQDIFTKPNLNQVDEAFTRLKPTYNPEISDEDLNFDAQVNLINTNDFPPFKPISRKDLNQVDLKVASQFFKSAFSHPENFVLVITGDFDPDNVRPWLDKYLGEIPNEGKNIFLPPQMPLFPKGITTREVQLKNRGVQVTRLTLPLDFQFSEKHIHELEYICEVIEARLRKLKSENWLPSGIDVGYQLPFYPYTDSTWLSIQMHVPNRYSDELTKQVLKEIAKLIETGPTEDELSKALSQVQRSDDFWQKDNNYLTGELMNLFLWGWDLNSLERHHHPVFSVQGVQVKLKEWIHLNNYSKISTK